MILRGWPRFQGLLATFATLFVLMLALAFLVGPPLAMGLLVATGETLPRTAVGNLIDYYVRLFTLGWVRELAQGDLWVPLGILAGWTGLQVLFLSPLVGRPSLREEGRSLVPSVVAASLVATTGCAIAWVAVVEGALALASPDRSAFSDGYWMVVQGGWIPALGIWIAGGFIWYRVLVGAGRRRDPSGLDRHIRLIFAGTAVETALGTLAFLAVRRKHECFCTSGSFLSLVYSAMVLFWMCGPWAVLLATRGARSQWARGACRECGYPRRTDGAVCTECGHAFPPAPCQTPS
ncbi:MAG: hypothetical protein RI967_1152 [Planctomycetota bacterium]